MSKRHVPFVIVVLLALAVPATDAAPLTFERLMEIDRVGSFDLSPDGRMVAYEVTEVDLAANRSKKSIHLAPIGSGRSRMLIGGELEGERPRWSPDGKRLGFLSRADGVKQLFLVDLTSGMVNRETAIPDGVSDLAWMPDSKSLVLLAAVHPGCAADLACNEKRRTAEAQSQVKARVIDSLLYRHWDSWDGPTETHLLLHPIDGKSRDLTPKLFRGRSFAEIGSFDVSPNGREIVFSTDVTAGSAAALSTNSDLWTVAAGGGEPRRITNREGADTDPRYSPDGRWVAWRSQRRAGYESDQWELMLLDRSSGETRRLAKDLPYSVGSIVWTPKSDWILVTVQEKGREAIWEVNVASGEASRLHSTGDSDHVAVTPDGSRIVFRRSSLRQPHEVHSMTRRGGSVQQVTRQTESLMESLSLAEVEEVFYRGAGGNTIHAWLLKPPGFDAKRKYPAIVLIHGGPQGAWLDTWHYRWNAQMFASRGYVVFMPNPRGSTGYGQRFVEEISKDWAGRVYVDIMNGVERLASMPFVDAEKIGAAGGSYGGYMVNWLLGHAGERFAAFVSHAGLFDLRSFYGATEELWFPEWEFGGPPWEEGEQYEKWSPSKAVGQFSTPTLVIHGELDYRVPVAEGMALFTALQRRNVPSRFLYYPDEGHWITKPRNAALWYDTVLDWFDRWLKEKN